MNILAVMGSYREGKTIDTLLDWAIEGAKSNGARVDKLVLIDRNIEYCRNCMVCRNDEKTKPQARCIITDDMQEIYPMMAAADGYIFGTPINMGHVTAVMKTFLERICWVFAKPGTRPIRGCPTPRTRKQRKAIIIASSGIISPLLRRFCDEATPLIKQTVHDSLNAKLIGSLYAGAIEKRGTELYMHKAFTLGKKLSCSAR